MTDAIAAKPAKLDISAVIGRTFSALGGGLGPFAILALLFSALPQALFELTTRFMATGGVLAIVLAVVAYIALIALTGVLQAAVTHGAIVYFNGGKVVLADCLKTARRTFLPVIGMGIIVGLAIVIGSFFLIVPGIIVALMWAVVIPVRVAEGAGRSAFDRSAALTKGSRWSILFLGLIAGVIVVVGAGVLVGVPMAIFGADGVVNMIVTPLVSAAYTLLASCGVAALYYELRTAKEGAAPATLAAVFD